MNMKQPLFEELITKAGRQVELSSAEREKMRFVLREYAGFNPRRAKAANPLSRAWTAITERSVFTGRVPSFALALLLIVTVSGGVASAAEGTVPGDALYPIKVAILEPLQTSLMFSGVEKSAWQRTLAERRLREAATLARTGALKPAVEAKLRADFEQNVHAALLSVKEDETDDDISSADFASRLSAYESVLARIDGNQHATTTGALQSAIHAQLALTASSSAANEKKSDVADLKKAAKKSVDVSAELLGSVKGALSSSTSQRAREAFEEVQALSTEGERLLKDNDAAGASQAFWHSLDAAARLEVFTRAAATLDVDAFGASATTTPEDGGQDEDFEDDESEVEIEGEVETETSAPVQAE